MTQLQLEIIKILTNLIVTAASTIARVNKMSNEELVALRSETKAKTKELKERLEAH
jgi:hypothetical protein